MAALKIKIVGLHKLEPKEQLKIITALKDGEEVLNSNIFKLKVLYQDYYEDNGHSPRRIYENLMSGCDPNEDGNNNADSVLSIDITGFFSLSNTVGYTNLRGFKTYINRSILGRYDSAEIFGHVIHETMHRLNYAHRNYFNKRKTVPYLVGYAARDAFKEYYKNRAPSKLWVEDSGVFSFAAAVV